MRGGRLAAGEVRGMTGGGVGAPRPGPVDRLPSTRLSARDRRTLGDSVVAMTAESDPTA